MNTIPSIKREFYNRAKDRWEFLLDSGVVMVQETDGHTWTFGIPEGDLTSDDWDMEHELHVMVKPAGYRCEDAIKDFYVHQNSTYRASLFAYLGEDTKGELELAMRHIEADDLDGAFAHLVQFAALSIEEFAELPKASACWRAYGPQLPRHKYLRTNNQCRWEVIGSQVDEPAQ